MDKKCFIAGLPSSGKTTFLAALWHLINYDSDAKLKLSKIENGQYLANLSKKWVNMEPLDRTFPINEKTSLSIKLELPNTPPFDLFLPDLSGETFQNQYEMREIAEELATYIIESDNMLFFINVNSIKSLGMISEHSIAKPIEAESNENDVKRNPREDDPLQVQVIELLQFILYLRKNKKIKVGFIFSAWDLMKSNFSDLKPEQFLEDRMNMLWQFCKSNYDVMDYYTWGVSAQGGELDKKELLLDKDIPYQRILVEGNDGYKGYDLTLPLYVLMEDIE